MDVVTIVTAGGWGADSGHGSPRVPKDLAFPRSDALKGVLNPRILVRLTGRAPV